jgi:hypothetical protein
MTINQGVINKNYPSTILLLLPLLLLQDTHLYLLYVIYRILLCKGLLVFEIAKQRLIMNNESLGQS